MQAQQMTYKDIKDKVIQIICLRFSALFLDYHQPCLENLPLATFVSSLSYPSFLRYLLFLMLNHGPKTRSMVKQNVAR